MGNRFHTSVVETTSEKESSLITFSWAINNAFEDVFTHHPLLWSVRYIKAKQPGEKQVKKIKTTPENFRYLRLSMSLHEVEDYTFIVFHMVSWPSLFWRKWEQTSIFFLGPSFEESIKGIKWTSVSKQSPVDSHPPFWSTAMLVVMQSFLQFKPYKMTQSLQTLCDTLWPLSYIWGNRAAEIFSICQKTANTGELGLELRVDAKDVRLLITVPSAPLSSASADWAQTKDAWVSQTFTSQSWREDRIEGNSRQQNVEQF